jgi:hypothetical protein
MPQYRVHFEQSIREEVTIYVEAATREAAEKEARHRKGIGVVPVEVPEIITIEEVKETP